MKAIGLVVSLAVVFLSGCGKESPAPGDPGKPVPAQAAPKAGDAPPQSTAFASALPLSLANLSFRSEGACSVDAINGERAGAVTQVSKAEKLRVGGWGVIPRTRSVPEIILVELASEDRETRYYAVAKGAFPRPDVAQALKTPAYEKAGFNLSGGLDAVAPGAYDVNVVLVDGAVGLVCFGKKMVQVK